METGQKAANRTDSWEVGYPAKCKSAAARGQHKHKTLENPEVLFTDYNQHKEGRKKNNCIFFTDSIYIWKDTRFNNYAYVSSEGISQGGTLKISKNEHLNNDDPLLTITNYTKGKIMVQGNKTNLETFKEAFSLLKAEVDTKRIRGQCPRNSESGPPCGPSDRESASIIQ